MLNGIGGVTIAQAKQNISVTEFNLWVAYRNKYGLLNQGLRGAHGVALLATMYANAHGKRPFKQSDFLDYDYHASIASNDLQQALLKWVN